MKKVLFIIGLLCAPVVAQKAGAGSIFTSGCRPTAPVLSSLSSTSVAQGSNGFTLTVTGAGFDPGTLLKWGSAYRATSFTNANTVTVSITTGDLVSAGAVTVQVLRPGRCGGISNALPFYITTGGALAISPGTFPLGRTGSAFNLQLNPSGGTPPYTFALQSGAFPSGLGLNTLTGLISGTPSDDLKDSFTIRLTDVSAATLDQSYVAFTLPALNTSKPILVIMGDSITEASVLANPATDGIKAKIINLLGSTINVCAFGFSGFQIPGIASQYASTAQQINPALFPKAFIMVEGGANDIQVDSAGANSLTGAQLAQRLGDALALMKADGWTTIAQSVFAWGGTGNDEPLRLAANALIRGGGYGDILNDSGGLAEFNSLAACDNLTFYVSDKVHLTAEGNRRWARKIVEAIGAQSGMPLAAVFDLDARYNAGENLVPVNIPFGGSGTKSYAWFVDGLQVSTLQNPSLAGLASGRRTIRLDVSTLADGTMTFSRNVEILPIGNVGGGAVTPITPTVAQNGTVALTAENVTSPSWRIKSGSGSLSATSGGNITYTASSPFTSPTTVEAFESFYDSVTGGTVLSNGDWQQTSVGSPTATGKGRLNIVGDKVTFYIPNRFANGSYFGLSEQATANAWRVNADGTVTQRISGVTTTQASGVTLNAGDAITFEIVSDSGSQKIQVARNGTPIVICTGAKNNGFYLLLAIYSEDTIGQTPSANVTYPRPNILGSGITNWRAGVSVITIE